MKPLAICILQKPVASATKNSLAFNCLMTLTTKVFLLMTRLLTIVLTKTLSNGTWGEYFPCATARITSFDVISGQEFKVKCYGAYDAFI